MQYVIDNEKAKYTEVVAHFLEILKQSDTVLSNSFEEKENINYTQEYYISEDDEEDIESDLVDD